MVGVESGQSQDFGGLGEVRWLRTSVSDSVVWVPLGPLVRVREEYPPFMFFFDTMSDPKTVSGSARIGALTVTGTLSVMVVCCARTSLWLALQSARWRKERRDYLLSRWCR